VPAPAGESAGANRRSRDEGAETVRDAPNAGMMEFWNGEASGKWTRFQETMDESMAPLGVAAMEAVGVGAGERVIDVGCGCGGTVFELAGRVGHDGAVHGLDISEPMLAWAKKRAVEGSYGNLVLTHGDAQVHAFEKAAYDVVFSRFGVMFFDDPVAAFENLKSALVPGGRLGFICWQAAKDNAWVRVPAGIAAAHVPLPPPLPAGQPGEFAFADGEYVRRILDAAGFVDVVVTGHAVPMLMAGGGTVDEAVAYLTQMGSVARAVADAGAGEEVVASIADELRRAIAPHATDDGVVMDCATWIVTARKP
jgi:SAM-dependent methyltransferase